MRITDIIEMGFNYLWLGILAVVFLGSAFFAWYVLYFKKKRPGEKLNKGKVLLFGVFFVYLVVVCGATMLSRGSFYGNAKIYPLFYSYKDAWNDFSMTEWRNIILNILMFVPFGVLLPLLVKKTDTFWKVSVLGFAFTLVIEVSQLLFKRGIFEPDDLLGNTVGAMIGYGVYYLGKYLVQKRKKEVTGSILSVVLMQMPFLITVIAFGTIFLSYHLQELGNLRSAYIMKQENIEVKCDKEFQSEPEVGVVYQTTVLTEEETMAFAKDIFLRQGYGIDESRTDIYENTALYYSEGEDGNRFSIWLEYDGGVFRLNDFTKGPFEDECVAVKKNATEEEIRKAFSEAGVFVPSGAVFEVGEEGEYSFWADKLVEDDRMYDGYIECTYYEDGQFGMIDYQILALNEYKDVDMISEKDAYAEIEKGKFHYWRQDEGVLELRINGVELGYELDTKGFYQPVYFFDAVVKDFEMQIAIPAIK